MSGFWRSWSALSATVVGAGAAGRAAARLLARLGTKVFITDVAPLPPSLKERIKNYEERGHTLRALRADLLVVSPGIPPTHWLLRRARRIRLPRMGELELAWRNISGRVFAITGTNGKSTVAEILAAVLGVRASGNVGLPLSALAPGSGDFVVECSSFQLSRTDMFRPEVAVILNIDQDHIDWHGSLENYARAKARIFANQTPRDVLVLNLDCALTRSLGREAPSRVLFFSLHEKADAHLDGDDLVILGKRLMSREELTIPGLHNISNALAAGLAAAAGGVSLDRVRRALLGFRGLAHRVQFVRELGGIKFYDDSKGTNPHATRAALRGFSGPVVLILGGLDKGVSFEGLLDVVRERVRAIVAMGASRHKIAETFSGVVDVLVAEDMRDAVKKAFDAASPGDAVLLSPACASFDMYENYKKRGEDFQNAVRGL